MNKNIELMLRLQNFFDKALNAQKTIDTCENNIDSLQTKLEEAEKKYSLSQAKLKQLEKELKEKELSLAENDEKLGKLEKKRELVKTEREQQAISSEIELAKKAGSSYEDDVLSLMDTINEEQTLLEKMKKELEEQGEKTKQSIVTLEKEIEKNEKIEAQNKDNYSALLPELDGNYRQRFDKLINSKKSKIVGEVHGEVCGVCNFQIPTQLAKEASRNENVVSCTNCGAFIYKQQD